MEIGVALRSEVFEPPLIKALAPELDHYSFTSVWFPDVAGYDSLELAALTLGGTRRVRVGTGVLRFYENEPNHFAKRVRTIQAASSNRLIVGVGTGSMHGAEAVRGIREWVGALRKLVGDQTEIYVSALRRTMFLVASKTADGVLLNFCNPNHVSKLVEAMGSRPKKFSVACYIKVFFAEKEFAAKRMFRDEFVKYDSYPHYHRLFEEMGVAQAIQTMKGSANIDQETYGQLSKIALYNPTDEELLGLVREFIGAGVDTPIVYPYVEGDGKYKSEVLGRLSEVFKQPL